MLNKSKIKSNPRSEEKGAIYSPSTRGSVGSKWIRHVAGLAQPASAGSTAPGTVVPGGR